MSIYKLRTLEGRIAVFEIDEDKDKAKMWEEGGKEEVNTTVEKAREHWKRLARAGARRIN